MGALQERGHAGKALLVQFEVQAGVAVGQRRFAILVHDGAVYPESRRLGSGDDMPSRYGTAARTGWENQESGVRNQGSAIKPLTPDSCPLTPDSYSSQ